MKTSRKNLLPKEAFYRDALIKSFPNIKPRFIIGGFKRLKQNFARFALTILVTLILLGFQPALSFSDTFGQSRETKISNIQEGEVYKETVPQLALPHPGYISSRFTRFHPGVDIATGFGMPIHPVLEGKVEVVNFGFLGYGNHVIIAHSNGYKTLYGHMGRVFVKKDQIINSTTTLGTVGMSGATSGPHTHLEIEKEGKLIDPVTILPKLDEYPKAEYLKPAGGLSSEQVKLSRTLKPAL